MCVVFVEYYPRTENIMTHCISLYDAQQAYRVLGAHGANQTENCLYNSMGQCIPIQEYIHNNVDWQADNTVQKFQAAIRDSDQYVVCNPKGNSTGGHQRTAIVERLRHFDVVHLVSLIAIIKRIFPSLSYSES